VIPLTPAAISPAQPAFRQRVARSHPRPRTFQVDGLAISAIVERGCEPVLFLHGNSSTKSVWCDQIAYLRQRGRAVLAPDFPGHGESEDAVDPERTYSLPGYAAIVSGLLDELAWDHVDVVGWSLGGHVALELLEVEPRIRSLLIVGTPPARPCAEALQEAFHGSADMELAGKRDFTEADARAYGTAMMGGPNYLTPQLLADLRRTDGRARQYLFASVLRGVGADGRACAENIDKPLCVVHGEQEPFVRLEYLRSLRYRALWKSCVQVITGAGHAPHRQSPADFNAIMFAFLQSVARS
jgi:pimeloyl-ACP methyl ester carboxylesterase